MTSNKSKMLQQLQQLQMSANTTTARNNAAIVSGGAQAKTQMPASKEIRKAVETSREKEKSKMAELKRTITDKSFVAPPVINNPDKKILQEQTQIAPASKETTKAVETSREKEQRKIVELYRTITDKSCVVPPMVEKIEQNILQQQSENAPAASRVSVPKKALDVSVPSAAPAPAPAPQVQQKHEQEHIVPHTAAPVKVDVLKQTGKEQEVIATKIQERGLNLLEGRDAVEVVVQPWYVRWFFWVLSLLHFAWVKTSTVKLHSIFVYQICDKTVQLVKNLQAPVETQVEEKFDPLSVENTLYKETSPVPLNSKEIDTEKEARDRTHELEIDDIVLQFMISDMVPPVQTPQEKVSECKPEEEIVSPPVPDEIKPVENTPPPVQQTPPPVPNGMPPPPPKFDQVAFKALKPKVVDPAVEQAAAQEKDKASKPKISTGSGHNVSNDMIKNARSNLRKAPTAGAKAPAAAAAAAAAAAPAEAEAPAPAAAAAASNNPFKSIVGMDVALQKAMLLLRDQNGMHPKPEPEITEEWVDKPVKVDTPAEIEARADRQAKHEQEQKQRAERERLLAEKKAEKEAQDKASEKAHELSPEEAKFAEFKKANSIKDDKMAKRMYAAHLSIGS